MPSLRISLILAVALAAAWAGYAWWGRPAVDFNKEIRPMLNRECLACHGGVKQSGGFSLLFEEEAFQPAESGRLPIVRGDAGASELIRRITHHDPEERMPHDAPPLAEADVRRLKRWINQGAPWGRHWAYVPPDSSLQPPSVADAGWPVNGIDRFILARLEAEGLTPSPEADRAALIRRLSLDLTGLPPSADDVDAFLSDPAPDAYERSVDRLLASPHFGERWASMWLDLARYADSKGYEKDLDRSIWKYRDWVIDAFNRDLPFDRFTVEQLAGDLLPAPTQAQYLATAFHRNTMANDEGGTNDEEYRIAALIDRVGTTFEVWQGTTMACVQCHSHPYDPIRHEEFYEAMAFFNNTVDRDIYNEAPRLFTYEPAEKRQVDTLLAWLTARLHPDHPRPTGEFLHDRKEALLYGLDFRRIEAEDYQASSRFIELTAPEQASVFQIQDSSWVMYEGVDLTDVTHLSFRYSTTLGGAFIDVRLDSTNGEHLGTAHVRNTGDWEAWRTVKTPIRAAKNRHDVYLFFRADRELVQELFRLDRIDVHKANPKMASYNRAFRDSLARLAELPTVTTPILRDRPPERHRTTRRFERGNWLTPADTVRPGVPSALFAFPDGAPRNRLGLARWLVDPGNPLTARVTINRFWEQIFGYGLVETVEDFGTQGAAPSHPGLIDWLAVQFMHRHRWHVKPLLKQIVMSATYRQAATVQPEVLERDPHNRLLARSPRTRLTAEQLRDQALAVSGLLNPQLHGPPVLPAPDDQHPVARVDPYRRSLYTFWRRTFPEAFRITFDAPMREVCTSRRIRTNTPLQALVLLNDTLQFQAAFALGGQMDAAAPDDAEAAIRIGYQRLIVRKPEADRLAAFLRLYHDAYDHYKQTPDAVAALQADGAAPTPRVAALTLVANALLNMDEFVTRP